jgi:7,8-dihydro-6-hydroxymethylpterin-pyrophosphokinase
MYIYLYKTKTLFIIEDTEILNNIENLTNRSRALSAKPIILDIDVTLYKQQRPYRCQHRNILHVPARHSQPRAGKGSAN